MCIFLAVYFELTKRRKRSVGFTVKHVYAILYKRTQILLIWILLFINCDSVTPQQAQIHRHSIILFCFILGDGWHALDIMNVIILQAHKCTFEKYKKIGTLSYVLKLAQVLHRIISFWSITLSRILPPFLKW